MAKKKHCNPKAKGRLYVVHPPLDVLVSFCENVKNAADISGIEYSNFVKACKLEKDIRISTYQKCAAGFDKDVLLIHLPCGLIESVVTPKQHLSNRFYCIKQEDLIRILNRLFQVKETHLSLFLESFWDRMTEETDEAMMRRFLSSMIELCQKLLEVKENGNV